MTTIKLSEELINEIKNKIKESESPEVYWDHRQELSGEQVNKILASEEGEFDICNELSEHNMDYESDLELEHLRYIVKQFSEEIGEEMECDDTLKDDDIDEIIDNYDLRDCSPGVDINLEGLIRNSSPRVVLKFKLYHEHEGWSWKREIRYEDVKDVLQLFNINPRDIHKSFPYHPRRKGRPYIKPKDLIDLWDNAPYGGHYVIPIDLDLKDYKKNRDHYHTGIILHKGTRIWMHDYWNGSGSIDVPLQKKLKIMKADLTYKFGDDRDTAGYGLDEVYGLCSSAWNNDISPVIIKKTTRRQS